MQQVGSTARRLHEGGVARGDRVAIVLPNGPEMATAFLSVAAATTCAPLNPTYTESEFAFYLADLRATAVVIPDGSDGAVQTVARRQGLKVFQLRSQPDAPAGLFDLATEPRATGGTAATDADLGAAQEIALLLHTSGTTARPKLVPLSHANICISAQNIGHSLQLTERDRCLNVMPLYHIHGLIGALLSSISAGASLVAAPGCVATEILGWMEEFRPSWYTAVPTNHHTILSIARHRPPSARLSSLRFIRSSSAPLPKRVMESLEEIFRVPVIEAYGMTEAAHQLAANPLPPGRRKAESVGLPTGTEVAVIDTAGQPVRGEEIGEVVVRGPSVMRGYENNPDANAASFLDGWFRTGDQGFLDGEGYITLTGRLKEIINRGGEKVAPREIDQVLMEHPDVVQAVAFAAPHATLGEDVAAAVVVRTGSPMTSEAIRHFAAARLAPFKVPRRLIIVNHLPTGATGKIQRIGLAEHLGMHADRGLDVDPPQDAVEKTLANMWQEILNIDQPIGRNDDFFDLGGNSMQISRLFADIESTFGTRLPLAILFQSASLKHLATAIREHPRSPPASSLVSINTEGSAQPLFWAHETAGEIFGLRNLAFHLGTSRPLHGFQARGIDGKETPHTRLEEMADHYVRLMRTVQVHGPYRLGGQSFGGVIAFEIARQLQQQGEESVLILIDAPAPMPRRLMQKVASHVRRAVRLRGAGPRYVVGHARLAMRRVAWKLRERIRNRREGSVPASTAERLATAFSVLRSRYRPGVYPGRAILLRTAGATEPDLGWGKLIHGGVEVHPVPGPHGRSLSEPYIQVVGPLLRECLARVERPR